MAKSDAVLALHEQLSSHLMTLVSLSWEIEKARDEQDWDKLKHFNNLVKHAAGQIDRLTDLLEASTRMGK